MRKLIKKSLAICLVAMLVLSAFVGTFAVSAESVATVTASEVEVEAGTTEVTVPVTIEVTDGFYAAFIQVQSEFGALTAVSIPEDADYNVTADDYTAVDLATGKMLVMSIYGDDTRNDITEAVLNCTFTADAAPAAGDYAVTVTLPEVPAADWAESAVALTPVAGKVTVKEAAQGPFIDYDITCEYGGGLGVSSYVSFIIPTTQLQKYASYEVNITRDYVYDNTYNFKQKTETITDIVNNKGKTYIYCRGIELYAMTIEMKCVITFKDAEGNVVAYSDEFKSTLADSLYGLYSKSSNAKQRTALADIINAGAEVQKFFTKNAKDSDLAKLPLPTDGKTLDDATKAFTDPALKDLNGSDNGITIGTGGGFLVGPYLTFNFAGIAKADAANYEVKLSYYNAFDEITDTKTVNLASTNTDEVNYNANKFYVYYREMVIPATNSEVTAEIYEVGSDTPLATYTYTFETLINKNSSNTNLKDVYIALGKLGKSFRAFAGL